MAVAQSKTPVITYKPVTAPILNVGDRIVIGEVKVTMLTPEKSEVELPANIAAFKELVQNNPLITFKLHLNWKSQGVKYPGRSEYTKDSIQHYLNAGAEPHQGTITEFKHTFLKQEEGLLAELEVLQIAARNNTKQVFSATFALPEQVILYRGFNNAFEYTVSGDPDTTWLITQGAVVRNTGAGKGTLNPSGTAKTASIQIMAQYGLDTVELDSYMFRVRNLPSPAVYFGDLSVEKARAASDSLLFREKQLFVKYPPEITLSTYYQVLEIHYMIGGTAYVVMGSQVSKEVEAAIESAEPGTEIQVTKIIAKGPDSMEVVFNDVVRHTKITPKGTAFSSVKPAEHLPFGNKQQEPQK